MKRILVFIIRLILGLTFIVSGIIKGFDPMGLAYKIEEFFIFFSLEELNVYSRILSGAICSLELVLGIFLLLGVMRFWIGRVVMVVMILFSIFTFYLLINPNVLSDCGCFGDVLHLTNEASFVKNVLLLLLSIIYMKTSSQENLHNSHWGKRSFWIIAIIFYCVSIPIYSFCKLPVIDFLPYRIGTNLVVDASENEKSEVSPSFILFNDSLDVVTNNYISPCTNTLFIIIRSPKQLSLNEVELLKKVISYQEDSLYLVVLGMARSSEFKSILPMLSTEYLRFLQTDDTVLKLLLRCDNGLVLVRHGLIRGKWNISAIANIQTLSMYELENNVHSKKYMYISWMTLIFIVLLFVKQKLAI